MGPSKGRRSPAGYEGLVRVFGLLFFGFSAAMVVLQFRRARHRGPQVLWFPPSMRPKVNRYYREHGWPEPYDDDGERHPWWRD